MDKALTITCPHCGRTFALDEGILQPIRASILTSVEADFQARTKKEVELARLQAEQQAKTLVEQQTAALKQQAEESAATAKSAREREKAALDAQLKLTREKEELDLVYRRQMLEELEKARIEVRSKLDLDLKQRDQTIDGLKKQIEDLQRKAELGSQQAQGEALESTIKKRLETAFPTDLIEDVPTGTRGADVIQKVNGKTGRSCGTIIWESKQTKAWAHDWIAKLRRNRRSWRGVRSSPAPCCPRAWRASARWKTCGSPRGRWPFNSRRRCALCSPNWTGRSSRKKASRTRWSCSMTISSATSSNSVCKA